MTIIKSSTFTIIWTTYYDWRCKPHCLIYLKGTWLDMIYIKINYLINVDSLVGTHWKRLSRLQQRRDILYLPMIMTCFLTLRWQHIMGQRLSNQQDSLWSGPPTLTKETCPMNQFIEKAHMIRYDVNKNKPFIKSRFSDWNTLIKIRVVTKVWHLISSDG